MKRSEKWRRQYRIARTAGKGHRAAVLAADAHFGARRRARGLNPLDTPYKAIQSKGDKRGRVKVKFQEWDEDEVERYLDTGVEPEPEDTTDPDDDDTSAVSEMVQAATGRERRKLFRRGRLRRRLRGRARPNAKRRKVVREAIMGRMSAGDVVQQAAEEKGKSPVAVAAEVTAAAEAYSQAEDPSRAAAELAEAARAETDAELAESAALAAEVLSYTAQLAATPDSDVASDITTTELLDALQSVPLPTGPRRRFPMPRFGGDSCPSCQDDDDMKKYPNDGPLAHLRGKGIPDRFGSKRQSTAIPLASNAPIAAGATFNFALQPVSDVMPGAVLWISFTGSAIPPEITALSVSGQNQLYGVAGAGLSQAFADVANLQAPGVFIPVKIPANNSFQLSITNRDGVNPINVDVALVGTAVQLVQALKACGV